MPGREATDGRRQYAIWTWGSTSDGRPPRGPLPDYTWPLQIPVDQLRRIVALELQAAADLARIHFPDWK